MFYQTSIAVRTNGNPVIAYLALATEDLRVAACQNPACTGTPLITTVDGLGTAGYLSSIAVGADGNPIVAHIDPDGGVLKVAKCIAASCAGNATISIVDAPGYEGTPPSIEIGVDGNPIISYANESDHDLLLATCGNPACSGVASVAVVEFADDVGFGTSLAVGSDGMPVITHYDITNGDLRLAKCANLTCAP